MKYSAKMKNDPPDWLAHTVDLKGGDILCEAEIFEAPDGTWAVWVWKEDDKPVLGLPSREIAERVAEALRAAYRAGGEGDYYYD